MGGGKVMGRDEYFYGTAWHSYRGEMGHCIRHGISYGLSISRLCLLDSPENRGLGVF